MKTVCHITGTSSGIGNAFALKLLNHRVEVYGYGRRNTIRNSHYHHTELDLRDLLNLVELEFPEQESAERIIFVNNAGILGEIKQVGRLEDLHIPEVLQVNLTAPAMLMNKFLRTYGDSGKELIILNISSGAAKYPVPGWSGYCASKAALDMYSQVIALEWRHRNVRIHSVAPGIVETPMQEKIRATPPEDFERVEDFKGYKKRGELTNPAEVALRLWQLIEDDSKQGEVLISFRN